MAWLITRSYVLPVLKKAKATPPLMLLLKPFDNSWTNFDWGQGTLWMGLKALDLSSQFLNNDGLLESWLDSCFLLIRSLIDQIVANTHGVEQGFNWSLEWPGEWAATDTPSAIAMVRDIGANSVPMQMTLLKRGKLPWKRSNSSMSTPTRLITSFARARKTINAL